MRKYHPIIIALGLSFLGGSCLALQTYPLVDQQSTKVIISNTEQNRIAVLGDRIQQVFGAEGTFDVQSDEEGGQIFLIVAKTGFAPTLQASSLAKPMTITIITEEGLTQDLKLVPKSIESQSILFKPTLSLQEQPKENRLQHAIQLLKALVRNEGLIGYIKTPFNRYSHTLCSRLTPFKSLKADLIMTYQGEKFEGKAYTLLNQGKEPIFLKESDFAHPGDMVLSLSKPLIQAGEQITLYVVSRRFL
ncbi:MAG: type-F conjugative transfer system secretin TraK [Alphaproteobacteria bacterium]|nr:type-F conjugative transfer system secretin TraK [Alphaproteobacteria bacterium]MBP9777276.1 type-F conjugative transfer system secretin TraK [Alphaproteobacteria bacterium]